MQEEKKRKFKDRLKRLYRVVILDNSTFEQKAEFNLTALNIFVFVGITSILFIFLMTYIIAFTSLREYIPGYADVNLKRNVATLLIKTDSLENELLLSQLYLKNIQEIIKNDTAREAIKNELMKNPGDYTSIDASKSEQEKNFIKSVEEEEKNNLSFGAGKNNSSQFNDLVLFTPAKGLISTEFNPEDKHFGIDIVTKKDEAVLATLAGTVVFSGYSTDDGYIIHLQHDNGLTSIYKHNAALLKKTGDKVESGQAIAIVGNTGELSNGPHLHFELWHNGNPINPQKFIRF